MSEDVCRNYREDMLSHFEGGLDKPTEAALMGHLDMCCTCREVYECFDTLRADLEAIGDGIAASLTQVNVVEGVMEAVRQAKRARRVIVSFEPPAPRRRFGFLGWMGLGAAAAAILVLWFAGYRLMREPDLSPVMRQAKVEAQSPAAGPAADRPHAKPIEAPASKAAAAGAPSKTKSEEIKRLLSEESLTALPTESVTQKDKENSDLQDITVAEILALRRIAAGDSDADARQKARARLAEWASLSERQARALVGSDGVSLDVKVGAAQSLPAAEAERMLLAAVEESPDDAYLHSELAKAYLDQPDKQAEATDQLLELSELDPDNALTQYRLASTLLRQGDVAGATTALDAARSLKSVDTYASEADASRQQALQAAGMTSDAARVLTALTSGMDQYVDLIELAGRLLEQGQQAEEQGNTSFAKDLYESVQMMGSQVAAASTLSSELMAGLDIQSSAIDSLYRVVGKDGSAEETQALAQQVNQLAEAYNSILQFFEGVNAFFSGDVTEHVLQLVSDFILDRGDLNLIDYISSLTPSRGSESSTIPAQ